MLGVAEAFRASVRLRRVARQLRQWRDAAGKKGQDIAPQLRWSPAKLSKIENAAQPISPVDVIALALIYGVSDPERDQLFQDAVAAQERQWWEDYGTEALVQVAYDFVEQEAEAARLSTFKTDLIPGLLQTHGYAEALALADLPKVSEEVAKRRAEVRTARQGRIRGENPLRFEAVIGEAALRQVVGGAEVMLGQLERLLELAELETVLIQVLPFSAGAVPAIGSPFTVLSFDQDHYQDTVYVENLVYGFYLEEQASVDRYKLSFSGLQEAALDSDRSIQKITEIAGGLRSS
ncbi:helix-turn-helix transcriptional regulator [Allokutzneria multivorans]|uniref:Helix-turn-helix transcriptional regulator n=1 Tax=Allokutzneria multivorans TaxID=1142134 RepID=A0ABP7U455_9PSEU